MMNYYSIVPPDDPSDMHAAGYKQNLYPTIGIAKRARRRLKKRGGAADVEWEILKIKEAVAKKHPKFKTLIVPFGVLIYRARLRADVSQSELALLVGVSQPNIVRWERGQVDPSESTFYEIMEKLGQHLKVTCSAPTATRKTQRVYL